MKRYKTYLLTGTGLCLLPNLLFAGNALIPLGFGGQSIAMGGTDMGFSSTALGMNNNTAGIARISAQQLELVVEAHYLTGIQHRDSLGNDQHSGHDLAYLVSGGSVMPIEALKNVVVGVGFFAQGGAGYEYKDLKTDFGNRDELSALFGVFRLAPAIAWNATENVRVGLAGSINYSEADQSVFPNTSNLQNQFFGIELRNLNGLSYSWQAGLQLDLSQAITLGLSYHAETELILENGDAYVNMEGLGVDTPAGNLGFGRVHYKSASLEGLKLPQEIGFGFSWKVNDRLSLGADLNHYRWSDAIGTIKTNLKKPGSSSPMQNISAENSLGGQDNYSKSIGGAFRLNNDNTIYSGITHTGYAVDKNSTSPLNNLIAKWHFSLGYQMTLQGRWTGLVAYNFSPKTGRNYNNTQFPLGNESKEGFAIHSLSISIQYGD